METLSSHEVDLIISSGQTIGNKNDYPAVVIHSDYTVSKFWTKRSRMGYVIPSLSYASRFTRAAARLKQAGITVPEILSLKQVQGKKVQIVHYVGLQGSSVRDLLIETPKMVDIVKLADFFHLLHAKGILFRAIHLGNIIALPDGNFGLIDFSNVSFKKRPANLIERAKNLATPLRYLEDITRAKQAGLPDLVSTYLNGSNLDEYRFRKIISKRIS